MINLEILNLSNNHLDELPLSLSSMPKLRILNCSINRLNSLPRGFGAFPVLEVLDLSYNNLNEKSLPGNFFMMGKCLRTKKGLSKNHIITSVTIKLTLPFFFLCVETLRALYLGDNDFEYLPQEVKNLQNLQIVSPVKVIS